jgi:enterochelin esterase family protein
MKPRLFLISLVVAMTAGSCAPRARVGGDFLMEDDGGWERASTAHRLAQFPKVHEDGRVWFRFEAPETAESVTLRVNGTDHPMERDARGLWNVVIQGTAPGFRIYRFMVDGVTVADPSSTPFYMNGYTSALEYPAPDDGYYLVKRVPHGDVREHWFHSDVTGSFRRMFVYTPPGYDQDTDTRYPVLYLQHGGSDLEDEWVHAGRANFILDNLIAEGRALPMIVVMNDGIAAKPGEVRRRGLYEGWTSTFEEVLIDEVIPNIDASYRTVANQEHRAMAGLSMGGMQTREIALDHLDIFSHIGIFSGGLITPEDVHDTPGFRESVRVLFVSCGSRENPEAAEANQKALGKMGVQSVVYVSPDTGHEWQTWRRSLHEFAPLLFRE